MTIKWSLTIDCAHPRQLAAFWALALGYALRPPPEGFASWDDWLRHHGVPEQEWDEGAYLSDPDGVLPNVSLLKVPEGKTAKNRLHLDLPVSGGRHVPFEQRWPLVEAAVERLTAAGAAILGVESVDGRPDHVRMADPEGNEFCLL
jgi:Glyoxalase-like domain